MQKLRGMYSNVLFWILAFYFLLHLTNLTLLPIFNDESIYLDWAWSYTHRPGHLYDSLLDAKQPLMIWMFAFFENLFADPLYAGRFASVLIGGVTAVGMYKVTKQLINKHAAVIATLLYAITPLFVFYNRQALMEAAVACIGVWSVYVLLNLLHKPTTKRGVILGIVLGLGFFIKTSSLLFTVAASLIIFFYIFKKRKHELTKPYLISLLSFFCVNLIIFINPVFWETFSTNSRYAYTLAELFTFPFTAWFNNLSGFFAIGLIFITPLIFLCALYGGFMMWKGTVKHNKIFLVYLLCPLLLEILSAKFQGQRYLTPFLPLLLIPASYVLSTLWKGRIIKKSVVIVSLLIPLILSLTLIINPEYYIMQLSKVSKHSEVAYVRGQTSGHGINEAMQYIKEHSMPSQPTLVVFPLNAGNPENAVNLYSQKQSNFYALRIDRQFFDTTQVDCFTSKYPLFFVTRNAELAGMDQYFTREKSFLNPDGKYSVGIYTLKKDCKGKTASLSDFYESSMIKIDQIRAGNAL